MSRTYYEILGVPRGANEQEIKAAYHKLARRYHPDKAPEGVDAATLEAEFSQISTAYNVLKDREKRAAYDQNVELKRQQELGKATGGAIANSTESSATLPRAGGQGGVTISDKSRAAVARRAYVKGIQFFSFGEYAKAAEFFEVAIKNHDAEPNYHNKLALSLLRAHRSFSRATEAAQKAIDLDPYNSEHRILLGELYEAAGTTTMAIKTYEEILKWDATNEKAQMALQHLQTSGKKSFLQKIFGKK